MSALSILAASKEFAIDACNALVAAFGNTVGGGITVGDGTTTIPGVNTLTLANLQSLEDNGGGLATATLPPFEADDLPLPDAGTGAFGIKTNVPRSDHIHALSGAYPHTRPVPTHSSDPGTGGDYAADDTYLYVYGVTGWGRVALDTSF